jgi:hypothetical protein
MDDMLYIVRVSRLMGRVPLRRGAIMNESRPSLPGGPLKTTVALLLLLGGGSTLAAQGTVQVDFIDGGVSIEADGVELGTLLRELDAVAGTSSTVPMGLAAQRVSARISQLPLDQAIRKVFQGLALDYAMVGGRQIVVLAESQPVTPTPIDRADPGPTLSGERVPGAFEPPGLAGQEIRAQGLGGRGGRALQPLPGLTPGSTTTNPTLPGLGTALPFGLPTPASDAPIGQPSPGLIGNRTPAMLDLNRQQTPPAPPGTLPAVPSPRALPPNP